MSKSRNPVWRFFASVKLALVVLIILAVISIAGTLIKQGQSSAFYIQEYGPNLSGIFEALDMTDMYKSWWFIALLGLFAVNLIICSIDRLPSVWRQVVQDNLETDPEQLGQSGITHQIESRRDRPHVVNKILDSMAQCGWRNVRQRESADFILLFAQKGAWSRLGVYVVHLSILVVLTGALLGALFGFQAYVFLPEGKVTSHIFLRKNKEPFPLGFQLRCDRFEKTFYPNGMVKQFHSDLTIIDPERSEPYTKSIIVNDPLSYRGLTFYQGDAYPTDEYFILFRNLTTGKEQAFRLPPQRDFSWEEGGLSFRIDDLKRDQDGAVKQAAILLKTESSEPSLITIRDRGTATFELDGMNVSVSFRQYYSTLLLITRDPGVLVVYAGCILMVVGLVISFLFSHRRLWVRVTQKPGQKSIVLIKGAVNKNKPAFEQKLDVLVTRVIRHLETSDKNR